jgi:hypothetical protein
MNPSILFALASKNSADIEALVAAVGGISKALQLLPHLYAIAQTYEALSKQAEPTGT